MSNSETKIPAAQALRIALELMSFLTDVTERIQIGGSLRRSEQFVGDVELVMIPKFMMQQGLFGDVGKPINLLDERFKLLLAGGIIQRRLNINGSPIAWGETDVRQRSIRYRGVAVDVFIVLPDRQWGPTMLLRTGPGVANRVLVTQDGVKNQDNNFGILPRTMMFHEAALWYGSNKLSTPEEADVFLMLEMPYIPPHLRSVETYELWASRRSTCAQFAGCRATVPGYGWCEFKWRVTPIWEVMKNAG